MLVIPVIFLIMLIIIIGCAASVIAAIDSDFAVNAPKFYPISFAFIGFVGFASTVSSLSDSKLNVTVELIGMLLVVLVGAVIGHRAGVRRSERAEIRLAKEANAKSLKR